MLPLFRGEGGQFERPFCCYGNDVDCSRRPRRLQRGLPPAAGAARRGRQHVALLVLARLRAGQARGIEQAVFGCCLRDVLGEGVETAAPGQAIALPTYDGILVQHLQHMARCDEAVEVTPIDAVDEGDNDGLLRCARPSDSPTSGRSHRLGHPKRALNQLLKRHFADARQRQLHPSVPRCQAACRASSRRRLAGACEWIRLSSGGRGRWSGPSSRPRPRPYRRPSTLAGSRPTRPRPSWRASSP